MNVELFDKGLFSLLNRFLNYCQIHWLSQSMCTSTKREKRNVGTPESSRIRTFLNKGVLSSFILLFNCCMNLLFGQFEGPLLDPNPLRSFSYRLGLSHLVYLEYLYSVIRPSTLSLVD